MGIEVTTIADYFSLGIRTLSFVDIAPAVAALSESFYIAIIDHLWYNNVTLHKFYYSCTPAMSKYHTGMQIFVYLLQKACTN
jgi:hypothetical protein